ncbi:hypothetical protein CEXT_158211 [Caerostris extrusa]|uniref:Uncharacterized protein n=1 Tax=Caerostris extrusa TaxID=172846 RepID=A0AAV4XE34_CAEEX|nr:hypothetical protein CEXT_158211 [Caerostris extrusa]
MIVVPTQYFCNFFSSLFYSIKKSESILFKALKEEEEKQRKGRLIFFFLLVCEGWGKQQKSQRRKGFDNLLIECGPRITRTCHFPRRQVEHLRRQMNTPYPLRHFAVFGSHHWRGETGGKQQKSQDGKRFDNLPIECGGLESRETVISSGDRMRLRRQTNTPTPYVISLFSVRIIGVGDGRICRVAAVTRCPYRELFFSSSLKTGLKLLLPSLKCLSELTGGCLGSNRFF